MALASLSLYTHTHTHITYHNERDTAYGEILLACILIMMNLYGEQQLVIY